MDLGLAEDDDFAEGPEPTSNKEEDRSRELEGPGVRRKTKVGDRNFCGGERREVFEEHLLQKKKG